MKRMITRRPDVQTELHAESRRQLEYGRPMFASTVPLDDATLRELWAEHGDTVTAGYVKRWPGQRPLYWWLTQGMECPADQYSFLEQHDLLTDEELAALDQ